MPILHEDIFSQRSKCRAGYEVVQEMKWDGVDSGGGGGGGEGVVFSSCSDVFSSSNKCAQLLFFVIIFCYFIICYYILLYNYFVQFHLYTENMLEAVLASC